MISKVGRLMAVLLAGAWLTLAAGTPRAAEMSLCPVCQVMEGAQEKEEVQSWRTHDGKRYGFCSKKCAEQFDIDPVSFLPPVLPRPAPALDVTTLAGDTLAWRKLRGRTVLVDFWATWCKPCRTSMPELQALHDEYAKRGFTVVGISIDEDGAEKVRKFVAESRITYPIAVDAEQDPAWARFRVKAVPAAFLVDGEGRIVAQWLGRSANAAEVEKALTGLAVSRE